jgi:hypothetical protein
VFSFRLQFTHRLQQQQQRDARRRNCGGTMKIIAAIDPPDIIES